jgi:hypothetical protein
LSTQTAYLNIPHVTQQLVPAILLPQTTPNTGMLMLNHQVFSMSIWMPFYF